MGHVGHYKIEAFNGPWGSKACTFISGCPRNLYATLVLRGAPMDVLTKVKSILLVRTSSHRPTLFVWLDGPQFICYAYRNAKLESNVVSDDGGAELKKSDDQLHQSKGLVGEGEVLSTSWAVAIPDDLAKIRLSRQGINISRLNTKRTASEEKVTTDHTLAEGEESSESQICPTLLRVPNRPELALSCSINKVCYSGPVYWWHLSLFVCFFFFCVGLGGWWEIGSVSFKFLLPSTFTTCEASV